MLSVVDHSVADTFHKYQRPLTSRHWTQILKPSELQRHHLTHKSPYPGRQSPRQQLGRPSSGGRQRGPLMTFKSLSAQAYFHILYARMHHHTTFHA